MDNVNVGLHESPVDNEIPPCFDIFNLENITNDFWWMALQKLKK
jgi:hypothetical protein